MAGRTRVVTLSIVVGCLLLTAAVLPTAAMTSDQTHPQATLDVSSTLQSAGNNSTSHHSNPNNVSEQGDLTAVRGWLSRELANRLGDSAIQISEGQYERGRSIIGDDYDSRLAQLVDVVGDTDTDEDDDLGSTYGETRRTQRNFSRAVQEYERTYEEYQEARENGNETAARRYARELQRQGERVRRLNESLQNDYTQIEASTGAELTAARGAIRNVSANVSSRQSRVASTVFVRTELSVTTESRAISYRDPLVARGQLTTEAGEPVANREVTVQVYTRTLQVRTDDDGEFSLRYRPRTIPANVTELRIRYLPRNDSVYLGSNDTVEVAVEQVEATLEVRPVTDTVGFGEDLEVETRLAVDGELVVGVPVTGTIEGLRLDSERTNVTGIGTLNRTVPASIASGERRVNVTLALENRAIVAAPESTTVSVRETETTLTLRNESEGENLRLSGRLQTNDGTAVAGQTVRLTVGETIDRSVETNGSGGFSISVNAAELPATDETILASAAFDGAGTNLRSSSVTQEIRTVRAGGAGDGNGAETGIFEAIRGIVSNRPVAVLGGAITVVGLSLLLVRRRWETGDNRDGGRSLQRSVPAGQEDSSEMPRLSGVQSLFADGRTEAAVELAYQYVRRSLGDRLDTDPAATHWEFFLDCQESDLAPETVATVRELIEMYEQITFSNAAPSTEQIETLLEDVRDVV